MVCEHKYTNVSPQLSSLSTALFPIKTSEKQSKHFSVTLHFKLDNSKSVWQVLRLSMPTRKYCPNFAFRYGFGNTFGFWNYWVNI